MHNNVKKITKNLKIKRINTNYYAYKEILIKTKTKFMKFKQFFIITFFTVLITGEANSQTLTIQETLNYINSTFVNNKNSGGFYYIMSLSNEGSLKFYHTGSKFTYKMQISDVQLNYLHSDNSFNIFCKNLGYLSSKCIENDSYNLNKQPTSSLNIKIDDIYNQKKLFNSFKYFFELVELDGSYIRKDKDPFSPNNFGKERSIVINNSNNKNIALSKIGGVYHLPVTIGNLTQNFILDSGASDVLISQEIEKNLIDNKKITKSNYLSPSLYKIADGSIIECRRLLLPEIKIGSYIVKNVIASINSNGNTLLLGKSFLDKFQSWTIDNNKQILKLEK